MPPPLHKLGWSHISLTQDWSLLIQLWANKTAQGDWNIGVGGCARLTQTW